MLNILLRLTLDTTVSKDNLICATLQNTIEAILQGSRRASNDFEEMVSDTVDHLTSEAGH